ncbi:MAG: response regulator [Bacteroidetes bacterium]|nr:MAG: response regulator [Bacteroidota bacterium]
MRLRVFVIDADEAYVRRLQGYLALGGEVEVRHFRRGEEVVARLDETVDLVLCGLDLAGADGLEILRRIRARRPGLPVVMTLPRSSVSRAHEAMRRGATDFVTRGLDDAVRLQVVMDRLLDRKRSSKHPVDRLRRVEEAEILPLEEIKMMAVAHAHALCGGNVNRTAARLGITRATVYRLLRKKDERDA